MEKSIKEKIKEEKTLLTNKFKLLTSGFKGEIKNIAFTAIDLRYHTEAQQHEIFSHQFEMYYKREFGKLVTILKNSRLKVGPRPFEMQYEFFKSNKNMSRIDDRFSHEEICQAYNEVLNPLKEAA